MQNNVKNRLTIPLFVLIIGLASCYQHHAKRTHAIKPNPAFIPVVNPHPRYFMTVQGHISPSLKDKVKLKWIATYSSTEKKCDVIYNHLEGVVGWRQIKLKHIATANASGDYELKIPLDRYKPGDCHWKIASITDYSGINNHFGTTIAGFYPCGTSHSCLLSERQKLNYHVTGKYINHCAFNRHDSVKCKLTNNSHGFSIGQYIPRWHHYTLIESYTRS